jgi:hypothetical protein
MDESSERKTTGLKTGHYETKYATLNSGATRASAVSTLR